MIQRLSCMVAILTVALFPAPPARAQAPRIEAGAGKADITPPPGLATGGYGPAGAIARGQLTRLYARAIFLRIAGKPLLLVSVESFAVPQIFRARLSAEINRRLGVELPLPLESIVVAATHTHQGPANFLSAEVYNKHGSVVAGHVPQLRQFLLDRIAEAAVKAIRGALNSSERVEVRLRRGTMPIGLLRNRSPETFMLNRNAREIMQELAIPGLPHTRRECLDARLDDEQDGHWSLEGCPRLRAVDRMLTILDVVKGSRPIALALFGAVHPTVLPTTMPLFSGDFIGIATRRLERDQASDGSSDTFVAAFFNGAEGDITTRRVRRDLRDAFHHAQLFYDAVTASVPVPNVDVTSLIDARNYFAAPGAALAEEGPTLAPVARAGAASLGGAEGDRTPFYALGWRERVTRLRAEEHQGTKLNALASNTSFLDLTFLAATRSDFPQALPLGLIRLGELRIATVPAEISTATGYAIRDAMNPADSRSVVVVGLANDYASYTATADEYPLQDYMGASTLWGPAQADFIVGALKRMAAGAPLPKPRAPVDDPGSAAGGALKPFHVGWRRSAVDEDLDLILRDAAGNPVRDLPYFLWQECDDVAPYDRAASRSVQVRRQDSSIVDDDSAGKLIVMLRDAPRKRTLEWVAIWAGPLWANSDPRKVKFVVETPENEHYESALFNPAADRGERGRATCSEKRARGSTGP